MPLLLKDISWHQTPSKICIEIQVPSTHNLDIFLTPEYLKISAPPYFFESFLAHNIDVDQSIVHKNDKKISIEILKSDEKEWKTLSLENLDKESAKVKRQEALKWRHEYEAQKVKEKIVQERKRERKAIDGSLEAFENNRKRIEEEKNRSKAEFFKGLNLML